MENLSEVPLARVSLHVADLPFTQELHDLMRRDVDHLLAAGRRNERSEGTQTLTVLHQQPDAHWQWFFGCVQSAVTAVVKSSGAPVDEGRVHLRGWATRMTQEDATAGSLVLHNHSPAFLSAVYYLAATFTSAEATSGTYYANPLPQSLSSSEPGVIIPAREGRLVVFPSWVLHGPHVPAASLTAGPRYIIAVDAHLVPS